jgi:transcriptional regulator with XRE-family HTH domain/Zn-dependent peptidase ImmA (M78 family)
MAGLIRQGHFLGPKLRSLRKRNGLTLDELSARCVQIDAAQAPSVSYLSMVETGKRVPSSQMLELLAGVFGKDIRWFLDQNPEIATPESLQGGRPVKAAGIGLALEPAFLFSKELLQNALPELLVQTGTTGPQFARLLIRVWQETHQNDFPDIERAAEAAGQREMPIGLPRLLEIAKQQGLTVRWFDEDLRKPGARPMRARFEAPHSIVINSKLRSLEERLKYELAYFIGHRILHNGDGVIPPRFAAGIADEDGATPPRAGIGARDVLLAWRDFECGVFAGALLCPRVPFRQFLARQAHQIGGASRLGVTPAAFMRRMTAVSPYRHWHFFDAYPPGFLQAVYRGNGIALPWGNMSLVPDPCPRWAVFRLLQQERAAPKSASHKPTSQISIMQDGTQPRLYCCHSLLTKDSTGTTHVLSVGVDLAPALAAQGFDAAAVVSRIAEACRRGGGEGAIASEAAEQLRTVAHVLNIAWIAEALEKPACVICPRSQSCPRDKPCGGPR